MPRTIQLIKVDVCKKWADDGALRCAGVGIVVDPILHVACFQKLPDKPYEMLILDAPAQNIDQNVVVNMVKASFYVALDKPLDPSKILLHILERRVAAPLLDGSRGMCLGM